MRNRVFRKKPGFFPQIFENIPNYQIMKLEVQVEELLNRLTTLKEKLDHIRERL